jgi:hypothetical protein
MTNEEIVDILETVFEKDLGPNGRSRSCGYAWCVVKYEFVCGEAYPNKKPYVIEVGGSHRQYRGEDWEGALKKVREEYPHDFKNAGIEL